MSVEDPRQRKSAGRRQFLVQIDPAVIQQVKILAIKRGVSASSLVQTALSEFLALQDAAAPDAAGAPNPPPSPRARSGAAQAAAAPVPESRD